jgi:hypothetical protein
MAMQRPYPTRGLMDMLQSNVVESDDEFMNRERALLSSVPDQVKDDAAAANWTPWWRSQVAATNVGMSPDTRSGTAYDASLSAEKLANSYGLSIIGPQWNGGTPNIGIAADGPVNDPGSFMKDNTEARAAAQDAFNRKVKLRQENNIRQQQAYDGSLNGNNAWAGVLPDNYSDPNFGMVTGQAATAPPPGGNLGGETEGGLGGLGGWPTNTGAYKGNAGAFNPLVNTEAGYGKGWQAKGWGQT